MIAFERAFEQLQKPAKDWMPRKVFLFSGHMIDADDRPIPRFPKHKESIAIEAINRQLAELDAGSEDLALCGGACGGDLIFAEACLERQVKVQLHIPFAIPEFLRNSVSFAGANWQQRFYTVIEHPNTELLIMPEELGELPDQVNPYERNNLWQLYSAFSWGAEKVYCICLWDGKGGDGPGGTRHMYKSVKQRSGQVYILDTNALFDIDN